MDMLTVDETKRAMAAITAWRKRGDAGCPRCGGRDIVIEDRSARPHAEWYHLSCPACGLTETLSIPIGGGSLGEIN